MALIKLYNDMSQQTYLSLHAKAPCHLSKHQIDSVLSTLKVINPVKIFRLSGGDNGWEVFMDPWADSPSEDILGKSATLEEVWSFYVPDQYLLVDCVKGNPLDLRAEIITLVHNRFPDEIKRDFYLNNLSVKFGPHDVFEAVECPSGHLFAHTTFSVSIWGYRHPIDIHAFREMLLSSSIIKNAQRDLSEILSQEVEAVVYLA